jgi:hypothetical protein
MPTHLHQRVKVREAESRLALIEEETLRHQPAPSDSPARDIAHQPMKEIQ